MHTQDVIDRFNSKWKENENGCWIWQAGKYQKTGYGQFKAYGVGVRAHRVSWEIYRGPIRSSKIFVCHKCDVPECVNPDHLFLGSPAENSADMVRKGRSYIPIGEKHNQARLTEVDVIDIYTSNLSGNKIAKKYGISTAQVSLIRNRKRWAHIHPIKRSPENVSNEER